MAYSFIFENAVLWQPAHGTSVSFSLEFESRRNGPDQLYRFRRTLNPFKNTDGYIYGFTIKNSLTVDRLTVPGFADSTVKGSTPSSWGSPYVFESEWFTLPGKTSGTAALTFTIRSSQESWSAPAGASIPVDPGVSLLGPVADFTLGDPVTVRLTRYDPSFADTLAVSINGASASVGSVSDGQTVTFSASQLAAFYAAMPSQASGTAVFTVTTRDSTGTLIGTGQTTALASVPQSLRPSPPSAVFTEATPGLQAKFAGFVQSRSTLACTVTSGEPPPGAALVSSALSIGGLQYTGQYDPLNPCFTANPVDASGAVPYTVTVTDSRGLSASSSGTVTIIPYSPPVIYVFTAARCRPDGTPDPVGESLSLKTQALISPVNSRNDASFVFRSRPRGTQSWTSVTISGTDRYLADTTGSPLILPGFNGALAYEAELVVTDFFTGTTFSEIIATGTYSLYLRRGGRSASMGGAVDADDTFRIFQSMTQARDIKAEGFSIPGTLQGPAYFNLDGRLVSRSPIPVANGGTGQTTSAGALASLIGAATQAAMDIQAALQGKAGLTAASAATSGTPSGGWIRIGPLIVQWGTLLMTAPSSGGNVSSAVTFTQPFASTPAVITGVQTSTPNSCGSGASAISLSGFTLYFYRTGNTATGVMWQAAGLYGGN